MSCAGPGASDLRVSFSSVRMSAPPVLRFVCVPVYSGISRLQQALRLRVVRVVVCSM